MRIEEKLNKTSEIIVLGEKVAKLPMAFIKTKNQLVGIIIGAAIGLSVNMIPGLTSGQKMFVLVGCVLVIPYVYGFLMKRKDVNG